MKALLFKNGKAHIVTTKRICPDRTWLEDGPQTWTKNGDLIAFSEENLKTLQECERLYGQIEALQAKIDNRLEDLKAKAPFETIN